jgi:drug/metabolite transporter (DMT)-like permease
VDNFPLRAVLAATIIHFLWGGNPVAVKWGLEVFPPLASGFVRFSIGAAAIIIWAVARKHPLWPPHEEWLPLSALAVLFTIQITMMNVGYGMTSGSLGAILIALNPLFAAGFSHFVFPDDRLTLRRTVGLAVAFSGTALVLAGSNAANAGDSSMLGNIILLGSAALLGGRLIGSAKVLRRLDEVRATVWMILLSLPLFAVGSALTETIAFENMGWRPVVGILYQGLVVAGLAFMVNSYLMKRYSPTMVASFNFVSPVAGVLLSVWLLNESVGFTELAGLALVAWGLTLVARRGAKRNVA